jgi:hypothetical protein
MKKKPKSLQNCWKAEALISYYWRELPENEAKKIRRHLARCRLCAKELQTIIHFCAAFAETPAAPDLPDERRWLQMLQALKEQGDEIK